MHDGSELARGAGADDEVAEALVEDPGVAKDRHQGAERRRRQCQGDEDRGVDDPGEVQGERDDRPERERDQPADDANAHRVAADALEVDLHPGEEEEEGEPEGRERFDEVVGLRRGRAPRARR